MDRAHETESPRLAALFPGQGVQRQGMGAPWRDTPSWEVVGELSEASGHDVAELLLDTGTETLARTDLAQISVFAASLLSWLEFRRTVPHEFMTAFAGHSLGEYTALVASGALTPADGARLVGARGRAMAEAARHRPGAMAAVMGGDAPEVEALAERVRHSGEDLWAANFNSPQQIVVAGSPEGVRATVALAEKEGLRAKVLQVSAACHTPYMVPASEALTAALSGIRFRDTHMPVVSNVDARGHTRGSNWPGLCTLQLVSLVLWADTLYTLVRGYGCTQLTDFGPGRTMAALARRVVPGTPAGPAPLPQLAL